MQNAPSPGKTRTALSTITGAHTVTPRSCMGIEISSTVAPSPSRRAAASRTFASTSGSDPDWPNPSASTPMRTPSTPQSRASVYGATTGAYCRGSRPSAPATTSSSSALSATDAVMGPTWSTVCSVGNIPVYGTNPWVAFIPYTPENAAGVRIEPPWSPPSAMATSPEPTMAAQPEDEPPDVWVGLWGFSVGPCAFVLLPAE